MSAKTVEITLEHVLGAVGECLDHTSAQALLGLRADEKLQLRIEELADRCTEGQLTDEEREEYETLIRAGSFIAILQAKARKRLEGEHAA